MSAQWVGVRDDNGSKMQAKTRTFKGPPESVFNMYKPVSEIKSAYNFLLREMDTFQCSTSSKGRVQTRGACQNHFNTKRHKNPSSRRKRNGSFVSVNDLQKCECFPKNELKNSQYKKMFFKIPQESTEKYSAIRVHGTGIKN